MEPRSDEALAQRFEAALDRMGAYFMGSSPLQEAAVQIARRLTEMKIDYAAFQGNLAGTWIRGRPPGRQGGPGYGERRQGGSPDRRRLPGRRQAEARELPLTGAGGNDDLWQTAQRPDEDY